MRWKCEERGCYNVKHRPKIELFADIWPGKISMGDVDGIVEISGHALMIEWKSVQNELPAGQRIMFQRLTSGGRFTVFVIVGNAENMNITSYKMFFNGETTPKTGWNPANIDIIKERMRNWVKWAEKTPWI